jgi:hypothetical protein
MTQRAVRNAAACAVAFTVAVVACAKTSAPASTRTLERAVAASSTRGPGEPVAASRERGAGPAKVADGGLIDASTMDATVARGTAPLSSPSGAPLIQRLRLAVTTSSGEGNVTGPERMLDNNPRTAWNSRTGDLVGAWFEFAVPVGASVRSFGIIGGFANRAPRQDLFLLNHRIERLLVTRGAEQLGEYALDAASPAMQYFSLRGGPGVYRFTVTAVRPGARAAWREVCVSDFELFGEALPVAADSGVDAAPDGDATSIARTGSVAEEPTAPAALVAQPTTTSMQAYCARWRSDARRACAAAANVAADDTTMGCVCRQHREGRTSLQRPAGAFLGALVVARTIPSYSEPQTSCDLLVTTSAGRFPFRLTNACAPTVVLGGELNAGRPASFVRMQANAGDAGPQELTVEWTESVFRSGRSDYWCRSRWVARCTVDANNVPACTSQRAERERCSRVSERFETE